MLKDIIEKYGDKIEAPTRLNIVDVLTAESGYDNYKNNMKELENISNEIIVLVNKQEKLTNESGLSTDLITYLHEEGYENLTNESASEIAKDVYEKIKKAIKFLVDKFMLYYNKVKLWIATIFNNNEKKIKALIEILKNSGINADTNLLDNESFSKRLPMFKNFHEGDLYVDLLKNLTESYNGLFMLDYHSYNKLHIMTKYGIEYDKALLKIEPTKIHTLVLETTGKYKLKIIEKDIKSEYDKNHKIVMKKDTILSILEECLNFNTKISKNINLLNNTIEKIKNINPDTSGEKNIFTPENIEHNISVALRALHMFIDSIPSIFKDILFILTQHIRCYKK